MFYSQFILAKKGPLGTIWIAAHLERKLRKNQVADTDIGVSVDTILCPEVPIALRLSSHLLLGVVRIYSRKVNYLFDDCSEALLKIKQAFRSTAVDLPPEESKAPYHSITLPETFDLDDFELPDNDIFHGNYVDHHTSTREQITLQDNMENVVYPTSQFGLDERFGDGETSGLKLDEEFFLHKVDSAGHADVSGDHHSLAEAATPMHDDDHEGFPAFPESRVENLNVERDLMEYAQAPSTPGLVETPNLATIQEISACEDHMDDDDNPLVGLTQNGNSETISSKLNEHQENAQVDWPMSDDKNSTAAVDFPCEGNGDHFIEPDTEKRHSPNETIAQNISSDCPAAASGTFFGVDEAQGSGQTSNLTQMDVSVSTFLDNKQDLENVILNGDSANAPSISNDDLRECNGIAFNGSAQNNSWSISSLQIPEGASDDNQTTMFGEKKDIEVSEIPGRCIPSNGDVLELSQGLSSLENTHDTHTPNVSVCDEMPYPHVHILRPCSTGVGLPNTSNPDVNAIPLESFGGGEMIHASGPAIVVQEGNLELNLEKNYSAEPVSVEDIHVGSGNSDNQVNNVLGGGSMLENATSFVGAEFPAPETLLSLPEGHNNQLRGPLLDTTPGDLACPDESDAGSRIVTRNKRSYTASTLTEQSLYSVESASVKPTKRTSRAIPDDDDLLSSILVGRSSSVLKVKPTPPPYVLTSLKRRRCTQRTSACKRKVLLDDTMVLHGDTIRQQLIDTEDIRRSRKKAPCTLSEISNIRNQFLEDDLFMEPISTGVSVALGSLFNQGYDLSRIKVSQGVANVVSVLSSSDMELISSNQGTKNVRDSAPPVVETGVGECGESAAVKNCDLLQNETITLSKNKLDEAHEMVSSLTDLAVNPKDNKEAAEPTSSLSNLPKEFSDKEIEGTNTPSESVDVAQLTFPVIGVEADALVEREAAVASFDSKTVSENVMEAAVVSFDSKVDSENVMEAAVNSFDGNGEQENVMKEAAVSFDDKRDPENVMKAAAVPFDDKRESENVMEAAAVSCDDKTEAANVEEGFFTVKTVETGATVVVAPNEKDAVLLEGAQCADSIEFIGYCGEEVQDDARVMSVEKETDTCREDSNEPLCGGTSGEILPSLHLSQFRDVQGSCSNNGDYMIRHEGYPTNVVDAEISGIDMQDYNDFNYAAAANDTDFLNAEEDEEAEFTDDYIPNAEETRVTDNSGWSSRTRAVASYLQTIFMKEAEHDRKILPMENLLHGKTRKEASRMFFETLVLKSKDYVHVEQECPFQNINLKAKMKLLKSDF